MEIQDRALTEGPNIQKAYKDQHVLTILLTTRVLITVPKRRTSFWASEEPDSESGTLLMTNRQLQATGAGLSCRRKQHSISLQGVDSC